MYGHKLHASLNTLVVRSSCAQNFPVPSGEFQLERQIRLDFQLEKLEESHHPTS